MYAAWVSARHLNQSGMKTAVMHAATKETMLYEHYMATATQRDLSKRDIQEQLSTKIHMQCTGQLEKTTSTGMELGDDTGSDTCGC